MRCWALAALLLLAPAAAAQEAGGMIHVVDYHYGPAELNITQGTLVLMSFGPSAHTFTADDGSFDVDLPAPAEGEWTERSLAPPLGEHAFHCKLHPNMTGVLRVYGGTTGSGPGAGTTTTTTNPPAVRDPGFEAVLALAALATVAVAWRRRG